MSTGGGSWNVIVPSASAVVSHSGGGGMNMAAAVVDPTNLLHTHLASALSTLGDAQYWEESIAPSTIQRDLRENVDRNATTANVSTLLKCLKWLLAQISKGRDVSDFYVDVVKLVGTTTNLEVRKMVYIYLIRYCNHNANTQSLSLLSINSFQRGLLDREPLIRALALRVLTSIVVPDILSIQILGITGTLQKDTSPYVRKCAATAVSKLAHRNNTTPAQRQLLLELLQETLNQDTATMVLSSALISYNEITCHSSSTSTNHSESLQLQILHKSYRKLCHMLTDMDEWGQVVAIDVLTRYCRTFFKEPTHYRKRGSAEQIDATRRVIRKLVREQTHGTVTVETQDPILTTTTATSANTMIPATNMPPNLAQTAMAAGITLPQQNTNHNNNNNTFRRIIKRRVVRKGFYSDEEDESTEEEVFADTLTPATPSALRQPPSGVEDALGNAALSTSSNNNATMIDPEEADLDEDHRLLLASALPLLKSRNAGVVLAVCSLHYYCGVASIRTRKAIGQALVRIHRQPHRSGVGGCGGGGNGEIPFVVLSSIRTLVRESPSAFMPFLHDFFVSGSDPPYTKLLKLDILTHLALEPASIHAVLTELRTYVNSDDAVFARAAVQAVGKIAELARIVHERRRNIHHHNESIAEANGIALNCLFGLLTITSIPTVLEEVVGEVVIVIQRILHTLSSKSGAESLAVHDPNRIQERAFRRLLLLVVQTLSSVGDEDNEESEVADDEDDDKDDQDDGLKSFENLTLLLPPKANAAALWLIGEQLASSESGARYFGGDVSKMLKVRMELVRLLARGFLYLEVPEKEQAVHFASKQLVSRQQQETVLIQEQAFCERILALGRLDVNPDVRDRARFESGLIHCSIGLKHDRDAIEDGSTPLVLGSKAQLSIEDVRKVLLKSKPASSYIPLIDETGEKGNSSNSGENCEKDVFRFGTLSSLVGHRARSSYVPLPPWASENTPSTLRDPPQEKPKQSSSLSSEIPANSSSQGKFYEESATSSDEDSDSDDKSSSSSSSSGNSSRSSSSSSSSDTTSESEEEETEGTLIPGVSLPASQLLLNQPARQSFTCNLLTPSSGHGNSSSSSDENESSSDSEDEDESPTVNSGTIETLISVAGASDAPAQENTASFSYNASSLANEMRGLVLAPVVVDADPIDSNFDRDSGAWFQLVRPEHSGGLSVRARYLRGVTKAQQAQVMGFTSEKPTVVVVQILFENQKMESGAPFRRLCIIQRSSASSTSVISPRKVVLPLEIDQLASGKKSECIVGIDFASPSDRDGVMQAKFEIKFGSGSVPADLKPSIGDLLLPCKRTREDFDSAIARMHGFNRVESSFSVPASDRAEIPSRIFARAALTWVGSRKIAWKDDAIRFAGALPASGDPVYVLLKCDANGKGKISVFCDHALAVNSIMNLLKKAIHEKDK